MIIEVQWIYDSKLTALEKTQTNQIERLTKLRNSNKEWQCVNPQIRDYSNKVLSSKDFTQSTSLSFSSKVRALCSFQINTWDTLEPYSTHLKCDSPTNSTMQREEKQRSSASPIEPQTNEALSFHNITPKPKWEIFEKTSF